MKIGLVGYQGGGKSTLFELLTGIKPDPARSHSGQVGVTTLSDPRFDLLVKFHKPKKLSPARIELLDTPGLSRKQHEGNAQKLSVIREAQALVHVIGGFAGADPRAEVASFQEDLILADLEVVSNRIERLKKDATKPRPDREDLQAELETLKPVEAYLAEGKSLVDMKFSEAQAKACKSFSLLTRKKQLTVLNTADGAIDASIVAAMEQDGVQVVAAPIGLELEVAGLPESEREDFALAMGLGEPCRERVLRAIFNVTDQIVFYTCDEKEVHAWLLKRGGTALEAADTIHSDLARGFIRAEITPVDDLLRLGSERELKAAGLHHLEGKDYEMKDGDDIVVRFSV